VERERERKRETTGETTRETTKAGQRPIENGFSLLGVFSSGDFGGDHE